MEIRSVRFPGAVANRIGMDAIRSAGQSRGAAQGAAISGTQMMVSACNINLTTEAQRHRGNQNEVCFYVSVFLFWYVVLVLLAPAGRRADHYLSRYYGAGWHSLYAQQRGLRKKVAAETMGPGCAFIDYDNDGWPDILLINGTDWPGHASHGATTLRLYHNNRDGTFTDVTRQSGLGITLFGMGVAVGDYDNDGFDDIFITAVGQSHLFHNNGNGTFTDVTRVGRALGSGRGLYERGLGRLRSRRQARSCGRQLCAVVGANAIFIARWTARISPTALRNRIRERRFGCGTTWGTGSLKMPRGRPGYLMRLRKVWASRWWTTTMMAGLTC